MRKIRCCASGERKARGRIRHSPCCVLHPHRDCCALTTLRARAVAAFCRALSPSCVARSPHVLSPHLLVRACACARSGCSPPVACRPLRRTDNRSVDPWPQALLLIGRLFRRTLGHTLRRTLRRTLGHARTHARAHARTHARAHARRTLGRTLGGRSLGRMLSVARSVARARSLARTLARTHARSLARTLARTHARTHAQSHARSHALGRSLGRTLPLGRMLGTYVVLCDLNHSIQHLSRPFSQKRAFLLLLEGGQ